jgi:hypothetical protein
MSRAAVLILSVPLLVVAAPAVKPKAVYYHPTRVGDTRVYEFTNGDEKYEATEEITKVVEKDGVLQVTGSWRRDGVAGAVNTVEVSERGVSGIEGKNINHSLRLPAKEGETWSHEVTGVLRNLPAGMVGRVAPPKLTFVTGKEEEVTVPAGKFRAIRVSMEIFSNKEVQGTMTYWHAPGVGLVKMVTTGGKGERTQVLKSFKPAK